ncbi:MAG TPA: hypothetical protein DHV36_06120, partial [Desulfobacteraceae bacterium]|nr:hypothetical protein [Desulfobacteraceae bacterium]
LLLVAVTCMAGPGALIVSQFPEGRELLRLDPGGEKGFSLTFIHSVSNTPVTDEYVFEQGKIIQTAERFMAHGAGLPSQANEPFGISWERIEDTFVLRMHRPIPKLVVRTDRNYRNRLILGPKEVNLNQWDDQALLIRFVPGR